MSNLNFFPYYDDYDPNKGYHQLLAVPGRVAQAREFTQVQSLLKDIIKGVGDSIMRDGDVIDGCQVVIATDKKSVTVTAGKIYFDGAVFPLAASTVAITGVGTELIGVTVEESIVEETTDSTLRDPAQGYDNYNKAGCHRLKRTLKVVVNQDGAAVLSTLVDGELQLKTYSPEYDTLTQTLARRTYDESGSYIVNGLEVSTEASTDPSEYLAIVNAGKAYVNGYELGIASPRRIKVPRSTEYNLVNASNYVYLVGTNDYLLDKDLYVQSIYNVVGQVQTSESQSITVGTEKALLTQLAVVDIVKINVGATIYTKNTDYQLIREGNRYYVQWLNQSFPASGVQYTVEYTYLKTFVSGVDYSLVVKDNGHYLRWLKAGVSSAHPMANTNFTISYNQYLARKDVIYLDQYGKAAVKTGIPAEYGFEAAPEAPAGTLPLAVIMSPPNGSTASQYESQRIQVSNVGLTRFTMQDIGDMLSRIRTLEYDQAVLSLENDARQSYSENEKKGILADPFIDLSRADLTYNLDTDGETLIDPAQPIFNMAIDFDSNTAYLPVDEICHDPTETAVGTTVSILGRLATLGVTGEKVLLSQPQASRIFLVNPYSNYPGIPMLNIDPAVDNWVDETIIEVPVSLTEYTIVSTSTKTVRSTKRIHKYFKTYTKTTKKVVTTEVGAQVETFTEDSIINESAIAYIRPREINFSAEDFPPNLDNIKCYFDDKLVAVTPTGTTVAGTTAGSVRSSSAGTLSGKFMIPEGVKTGVRNVQLKSDVVVDGYLNNALTTYQAHGIARTIQRTITTLTTVLLARSITIYKTTYVDPVGQTFVLSENSLLSGVDIYVESKAPQMPLILEVRGVTNGLINSEILAHKSLAPSSISVSSNASVPTRYDFDQPVYIEKDTMYAIVLRSVSDDYRVWVAEMGEKDTLTGESILKNAYLSGVMMSSSNNNTWTEHQTKDLKFKLYAKTYATSGVLKFDQLTGMDASALTLLADSITSDGTSIDWEYSLDGSNFSPIALGTPALLRQVTSNCNLRATFKRDEGTSLTPILALDSVGLIGGKHELTGDYILKNVTNLDPFDEVSVIVETFLQAGTSINIYCSVNDGDTWDLMANVPASSITRNFGWVEKEFIKQYVSTSTQCRIRIHMDSNNAYTSPAVRRFRGIMKKQV